MKINRAEMSILKALFKSRPGLESFTLYRDLIISFPVFLSAINNLRTLKLISVEGQRIKISKSGAELISSSYLDQELRPKWREVPEKYAGKKIEPNEFYIPNRALI